MFLVYDRLRGGEDAVTRFLRHNDDGFFLCEIKMRKKGKRGGLESNPWDVIGFLCRMPVVLGKIDGIRFPCDPAEKPQA